MRTREKKPNGSHLCGPQTDHILTLVKQTGKEYSHPWDSRQESVGSHCSLQASNKFRFVSHSSLYPDCNGHTCLMFVFLSRPSTPWIGAHSSVCYWCRRCLAHRWLLQTFVELNCTNPIIGKLWLLEARDRAFMYLYVTVANHYI